MYCQFVLEILHFDRTIPTTRATIRTGPGGPDDDSCPSRGVAARAPALADSRLVGRRGTRGPGTGVNAAGGGFAPRARRGRRRGAPVSSSSTLARSRKCDSQLTCRVRFITDEGHEHRAHDTSRFTATWTSDMSTCVPFTVSHDLAWSGSRRRSPHRRHVRRLVDTRQRLVPRARPGGSAAAGSRSTSSRLVAPPLLGSRVALPGPAGPGSVSGLRVPGSSPGVLPRSRRRGSASGRRWRSWF